MPTQIEQLYSRHYDRMLLTARTLLDNDEDARDAVSDVFTELLASGKQLDELRAESYLLVSVRNRCMNMLEHRQVVEASEKLLTPDDETSNYEEPPLDQVLDYMDTRLTDKTSSVMKQRFLGRKKYNEIATDMGISRIAGEPIFFISYLICLSIQMGATIDYGILLCDQYRSNRRQGLPIRESIQAALHGALPTVLTSGTILATAGFIIGKQCSIYYISSIGLLISRGALLSAFLVLTLLPALLVLLDKYIIRSRK